MRLFASFTSNGASPLLLFIALLLASLIRDVCGSPLSPRGVDDIDDPAILTVPPMTKVRNPKTVLSWLKKQAKNKDTGKDNRYLVFYSNSDNLKIVQAFVYTASTGTRQLEYYGSLFDEIFAKDLGLPSEWETDREAQLSCSAAMAWWATEQVYVFNHDGADPKSIWLNVELPILQNKAHKTDVKNIWKMSDNAKKMTDTDGNIKGLTPEFAGEPGQIPPAPPEAAATKSLTSTPTVALAPPKDTNKCHGVSGNQFVDNKKATEAAKGFCAGSVETKDYNGGSDNAVTFSLKNPSGRSKVRPSKDVCEDKFLNVVIAGCDGNNPDNPFNVKYGGTYTDVNGWEYTMTPTAHRTPDNNCQFQWAAVLDIIDIRGKNWPQSQLQTNGEGLNRALGKCGVVKKWNFEATPDDTVYQWHASFTLGVWQKPCVVNAIKTAGGLTNTNCKGSS